MPRKQGLTEEPKPPAVAGRVAVYLTEWEARLLVGVNDPEVPLKGSVREATLARALWIVHEAYEEARCLESKS